MVQVKIAKPGESLRSTDLPNVHEPRDRVVRLSRVDALNVRVSSTSLNPRSLPNQQPSRWANDTRRVSREVERSARRVERLGVLQGRPRAPAAEAEGADEIARWSRNGRFFGGMGVDYPGTGQAGEHASTTRNPALRSLCDRRLRSPTRSQGSGPGTKRDVGGRSAGRASGRGRART